MIFVLFFGLVFVLVIASAVLGFATAIYVLKPSVWQQLASAERGLMLLAQIVMGLAIAIFTPLVAGLSYALSGANWLVAVIGDAGTWFWVWVGLTWIIGLVMGCLLQPVSLGTTDADQSDRIL